MKTYKPRQHKDFEKDHSNIIECSQVDNIQRTNVVTLSQEVKALEKLGKGKTIPRNVEYQSEGLKERTENKEALDTMDDVKIIQKEYNKKKNQYNELKKETIEKAKELTKQINNNKE